MSKTKLLPRIVLTIFAAFLVYFAVNLIEFFFASLVPKNTVTNIKVYPNQDPHLLFQELRTRDLMPHLSLFKLLVSSSNHSLRYGEYEIKYPLTAWKLFRHMIKGTGLVKHRLTIVEGWTMKDVRAVLAHDANLTQTIITLNNAAILQKLQNTQKHADGLFYPDTYIFTWGNSDFSVLKMAYQKMQVILNRDWQNRAPNLPYKNAYDALIVASMIERETALNAEKPMISSVILNRLALHMRLQIDPTVQYGLDKNFDDIITKKDLTAKNPYNTYEINGLPPAPICMPSESSIVAALHPAQTDYLYYVANGKGGHTFSKTYAEHEKAVEQYRSSDQ